MTDQEQKQQLEEFYEKKLGWFAILQKRIKEREKGGKNGKGRVAISE